MERSSGLMANPTPEMIEAGLAAYRDAAQNEHADAWGVQAISLVSRIYVAMRSVAPVALQTQAIGLAIQIDASEAHRQLDELLAKARQLNAIVPTVSRYIR